MRRAGTKGAACRAGRGGSTWVVGLTFYKQEAEGAKQ